MSSCDNPPTEKDALMSRRPKFDKTKDCVKCKTRIGNVVIRHAVYCKNCFFPLISTKFRKVIASSVNPGSVTNRPRRKAQKAAGNLLVGFSGGLGSTVLLDLVWREYMSRGELSNNVVGPGNWKEEEGGQTKLKGKMKGTDHPGNANAWGRAMICYVETCGAFPDLHTKDRTQDAREIVQKYPGLEFISLRIEDAFDPAWWQRVGGRMKENDTMTGLQLTDEALYFSTFSASQGVTPLAALQKYIESLPTETAVPSAVYNLVRLLLLYTARAEGASHLLLGTSLTALSINLISGVAQGAGYVVAEEVEEEWGNKIEGQNGNDSVTVKIVRPLRDVGMKECAIWAWWNGLQVLGRERYAGGRQGIGALTRRLETDYPATVSTIARTCAKLAPKESPDGLCVLCERPVQPGVQAWKEQISIRSYKGMPIPPPHFGNPKENASEGVAHLVLPHLCYACNTMLTSRTNRRTRPRKVDEEVTPLPIWVDSYKSGNRNENQTYRDGDEIWKSKLMGVTEMKNEIGKFMLEDT